MDVSASSTSSKTQKFFEGQDACEDKDLISGLPDDILVRIISLIPIKEAVRTSILAKSWKYLWLSIPSLMFYDYSLVRSTTNRHNPLPELRESFFESIERALVLRNGCLRRLTLLFFEMQVGASRFHSWLSAAVKHKVEKLVVFLPKNGEFELPDSLFTCESLSGFCLAMHCTLKFPSFICFSGLKYLTLCNVVFRNDQSAQQLFSGCPILEYLCLDNCNWKNVTGITIEIPTLKSFTFQDRRHVPSYCPILKIMISALNLETLCVSSRQTVEVLPCNLPSLNSASIDICYLHWPEPSRHIVKLLSGIQNVRSLKVSTHTLEPLFLAENLQMQLPTFYNLTHLQACDESFLFHVAYVSSTLVYILQKSPNLECLDLPTLFDSHGQDMIFGTVPTCFQSCLKQFIIHNFVGDADELWFLKCVYENAPVLDRLVIYCSPELWEDLKKQEEISHLMQQLCGASAGAPKIVFCPCEFGYYGNCICTSSKFHLVV